MKSKTINPYRFCPSCGSRFRSVKNPQVCHVCGFKYYRGAKPTVSAVITDNRGRVLLARRGIQPKKGWWDLPGGFVNYDEGPIQALRREMREELGVSITVKRLIGVYLDSYFYQYRFHTFNVYYECTVRSGRIRPMDDVASVRWFHVQDINLKKLAFRSQEQCIKDWNKRIKKDRRNT